MPRPPFAAGRRWHLRASKARRQIDRRVWHDLDDDFEYERDPDPAKGTWHRIDWRQGRYQEIDPETGRPVAGREGNWRLLR
jgi:hypothetical protein